MIDPDDLLDDIQDREENPISDRARGLTDNIRDEAIGRAKDKAKDAGKDLAKNAGKKLAKEGAKKAAQSGAEAAAGAGTGAAAGGGAAATGATVAATTGAETAGIGVVVGAAIAALGNKKIRNVTIAGLGMMLLLFIGVTIMTLLTPIIIVSSVASEAYELIEPIVENRAVQFGIRAGTTVVKTQYRVLQEGGEVVADGVDMAGDAADAVIPGDGAPCVKTRWGDYGCGQTDSSSEPVAATDEALGEVLAAADGGASGDDPNSRLNQLAQAMHTQGFFLKLIEDYGINIQTRDGETFDIVLNDVVIKKNLTEEQVQREFVRNKVLRAIMQSVNEQVLHVFDYSKRVTLAEKGMAQYQTQQLFIPGADNAREDAEVAKVKQDSLEVQNSPFISSMKSDLQCTIANCTEWVPDTSAGDQVEMTRSISRESNFDSVGSLYSRMQDRIKENGRSDDPNFIDWYHYVKEMHEKAKFNDEQALSDPFISASLEVRKQQATRLWFHQQTLVDQFKASQLTDKAASALFHNFIGGSNSKAYKYLSGQSGGVGFRNYDKINDNTPNVVKTVYRDWQEENPEEAEIVKQVVESDWYSFLDRIGFDGLLNRLIGNDEAKKKALGSAFRAGSKIMLPACDASRAGPSFVNCLYAGADNTARDVGMSDYGSSGRFAKADEDALLAYSNEIDQRVAASKPLYERMASMNGKDSFLNKLILQASVPVGSNKDFASFSSYLLQLPGQLARLAIAPFSGQVLAAEDEQTINNIDRSGIKLESLKNTPLSPTLDNPTGDISSCPVTNDDQENLCRADETTYLALAAKFGLLTDPSGDIEFTVGSYNILHVDAHRDDSIRVGGCATNPVPGDADCSKTRSTLQAQIITGQAGNPQMDIVGMQEVSPKQYNQLKTLLPNYSSIPGNTSRMDNRKDGALAIFWNNAKFTKFTEGKAAGISNTSKDITNPWVGLQSTAGHKVYVMSVHYPNSTFGGTPATIRHASRLTMDWVRSKVKDDTLVIVVGDFNDQLGQRLHYCVYTEDGLLQHTNDMQQGDDPAAGCANPDTPGIDHVYASPTMGVRASNWTHMARTGPVAQGSDHEPVYSTLTLPGSDASNLKIATFNILHVGEDSYEQQWRTRLPISINTLKTNGITVAGLQEVRPQQHDLLTSKSYATDTYDIFPKSNQRPHFSPNPIIWNKSLFSLVRGSGKTLPIEYDSGNTIDHAVQVKLEDRNGNQFYVLNTHDPANARPGSDQENALSRLHNAQFYARHLAALAREGKPIFLTGDFNSRYTMGGNQQPYNNQAENLTYCVISRGGVMKNVWDIFQRKEFRCPRSSDPPGPIDHIYVTGVEGVKKVWIAQDHVNGSDHPTVMAEVKMPWADQNNNGGGGRNEGGLVWPVARRDWPGGSMPVAECGLKYSDNTVHTGIDISVPSGTTLYAAADAQVIYKGGSYGAIIARTNLKAPDGSTIYLNYQHMSSITVGSSMRQGQPIGRSGAVGTGSPHLHFGVWKTGSFLGGHDPVSSPAGRATLSKMLHPMNYLPDDGRNVSECRKPYVVP